MSELPAYYEDNIIGWFTDQRNVFPKIYRILADIRPETKDKRPFGLQSLV